MTTFFGKAGWMVFGLMVNAITVYGLTDYLIDKSMSGFNTSQTNLSSQMAALEGSLNSVSAITNSQVAESRGDLAREVGNLATIMRDLNTNLGNRLEQNSIQLASLNSTLVGMDKRLNDTIARQEKVEGILLKQRVTFAPPSEFIDGGSGKYTDLWAKAGYDTSSLSKFDEVQALNFWTADTMKDGGLITP